MKKVIFFCVCVILSVVNVKGYSAALVMDADSGRVLYSHDKNSRYLIASTTKIMTALVVLNNVDIKEEVVAGEEILEAYGSSIYLKPQEKFTVEDLLYGLMLRSGNDAALVLAKYTAGSMEGFVKLMNDTALMIGMHDTTFSNPHGLDEQNENRSTVYDMCLLMREAMNNEEFRKISGVSKHVAKSNFGTYEWFNKNRLITDYKYATGGKIGYTTRAKHTFVSAATKDGKNLVIATFVDGDRFDTHKNLYEKYFEMYKKYTLIDKDNLKIKYKNGYRVYTTSSFSMLLKKDEKKNVKREVELYQDTSEEWYGTRIVGTMAITLNGVEYKRVNIYAEKLEKPKSFWDKVKEFFKW
mgnify:CR=1 FL=1